MPLMVALMFAAMTAMWSAIQLPVLQAQKVRIRADVQANNFLSYRYSLQQYVKANPGATGTVADGVIAFQPGYIRDLNWTNTVSAGKLYVYAPPGAIFPVAADAVYKRSGNNPMVGFKTGTVFKSSVLGTTALTLPAGIPDGSFVFVGN